MNKTNSNIIKINWINDKSFHSALVPGYSGKKKTRKLKEFSKSKGNCFFSNGISHGLIDFVYRAVINLKLKDKKLIFSKGAVKINGISALNAVAVRELDWDVGISIRIPHKLNHNKKIVLLIDDKHYTFKVMEIIVLAALLRIVYPKKALKWCSDKAVFILAYGWNYLILTNKEIKK
ncbi:MAG: hypothetical protein V1874_06295 [Spirochaetota bacterium]